MDIKKTLNVRTNNTKENNRIVNEPPNEGKEEENGESRIMNQK